jgi:hypothetical protein
MSIQENLARIRPDLLHQTIVAATKYVGAAEIRTLYALGITDMGENHAQALLEKQETLKDLPIRWHFIGHLQTNKVKAVINCIDCLHSLDSLRLAEEITKYRHTPLDCFIEVHISAESTKTGILPTDLPNFIDSLAKYDTIRVIGLMGMAENTEDISRIRANFMTLAQLRKQIESRHLAYAPCHDLSMGMSHDYKIAIECGATYLRLGSILFRKEE